MEYTSMCNRHNAMAERLLATKGFGRFHHLVDFFLEQLIAQ